RYMNAAMTGSQQGLLNYWTGTFETWEAQHLGEWEFDLYSFDLNDADTEPDPADPDSDWFSPGSNFPACNGNFTDNDPELTKLDTMIALGSLSYSNYQNLREYINDSRLY